MKKILLICAIIIASFSSSYGEESQNDSSKEKQGAHFLLGLNGGGSYWKFSGKDTSEKEISVGLTMKSINVFLGASYYFNNGITLGLESQLSLINITPIVQVGYMMTHQDQISLGVGYNILGRAFFNMLTEANNENNHHIKDLYQDHEELKNLKDLAQSRLSGASVAFNYRHFFASSAFFQAEVKLDYYNLKAKEGKKGELSIYDTTFNVGFGKEW